MSGYDAELDQPGDLIPFLFSGVVTANDDPQKLGRVRVRVDGLCEPHSAWALPLGGLGGASKRRGAIVPPEIGANVVVCFLAGKVDQPAYWMGPHRTSERVEEHVDVATAAWRWGPFRLSVTDTGAGLNGGKLTITNTHNQDEISMDATTNTIQVSASRELVLAAKGLVRIEGATVEINGRPVLPSPDPIK